MYLPPDNAVGAGHRAGPFFGVHLTNQCAIPGNGFRRKILRRIIKCAAQPQTFYGGVTEVGGTGRRGRRPLRDVLR